MDLMQVSTASVHPSSCDAIGMRFKSSPDNNSKRYYHKDADLESSVLDLSVPSLENDGNEMIREDKTDDEVGSYIASAGNIFMDNSNTVMVITSTLDGSDGEDETILVTPEFGRHLSQYSTFQNSEDRLGQDLEVREESRSSESSKRKRKSKCPVKTAETNLLEDQTKSFMCTVCGKVFNKKCNLQDHLRIHTGEKPYKCGICFKGFTVNSSLQVHLRTHTGEKPFLCLQCGKTFTVSSSLNAHMKIHTGDRRHQCTECHKTFVKNSDLKNHMTSHTGEKKFQCLVCYKRFSKASSLTMHRKLHLGEVYKCSQPNCDKEFPTSTYLQMHMKYHSKEKPFKCVVCDKAYRVKGDLQIHMRNHSGEKPFKCVVCFKGFTRNDTLILHMRTHTGEKPYECPICGKKFSVNCALHRHVRIHTGVKSYACVICAKAFDSSSNRQKHMKIHQRPKKEWRIQNDMCPYNTEILANEDYGHSKETVQSLEMSRDDTDIVTRDVELPISE